MTRTVRDFLSDVLQDSQDYRDRFRARNYLHLMAGS